MKDKRFNTIQNTDIKFKEFYIFLKNRGINIDKIYNKYNKSYKQVLHISLFIVINKFKILI